jgi:hypothetical protein
MSHEKVQDHDAARELAERVYHAIHLVPSDDSGLSRHVVWDMQQLMSVLDPDVDLTGQEVMAIAVVLAGANERRLRNPPSLPAGTVPGEVVAPPPLLRIVT